ncbi:MAG: hypothetical protein CM1200mP40_21070 [Gammaproteobacteria bacterium]|nr:MAG: hypothetical protein CM1200mP40_21070 [Gammaproteobacteria bacterium]
MKNAQARTTCLKDYRPPKIFLNETTDLEFNLYEDHAKVVARLQFKLNGSADPAEQDTLVLHGRDLVLEKLLLEGNELNPDNYLLSDEKLTIPKISELLQKNPQCVFSLGKPY